MDTFQKIYVYELSRISLSRFLKVDLSPNTESTRNPRLTMYAGKFTKKIVSPHS